MRNIALEKVARDTLNSILGKSISKRTEYGGMIYFLEGQYYAKEPREGYGNTVDIGQREPNCGCPEGSKPVAYYHTHPNFSAGGLTMKYNEFSPEDIDIAKDFKLDAYLGTLDGSFFVYDHATNKVSKLKGPLNNATPEE